MNKLNITEKLISKTKPKKLTTVAALIAILSMSWITIPCIWAIYNYDSTPIVPLDNNLEKATANSMIQKAFGGAGRYRVATTKENVPCSGLYTETYNWILDNFFEVKKQPTCIGEFPDGANGPIIGSTIYYPKKIAKLKPIPLIIASPGIIQEAGLLRELYINWASHGYVVAVGYNFINWFGKSHLEGALGAIKANQDKNSPLFHKINFTKTIVAGHSAGGGGSLISASNLTDIIRKQVRNFKVIGDYAIEPSPMGMGISVKPAQIPVLIATGSKDTTVIDELWPRSLQFAQLNQAPSYIMTVKYATHGTPVDYPDRSIFAALGVAWFDLLVNNFQSKAKPFFVGPNWLLPKDSALIKVERNELATKLK